MKTQEKTASVGQWPKIDLTIENITAGGVRPRSGPIRNRWMSQTPPRAPIPFEIQNIDNRKYFEQTVKNGKP